MAPFFTGLAKNLGGYGFGSSSAVSSVSLPPTFIASGPINQVSTSDISLDTPSGTQEGDFMLAVMTVDAIATWTPPAGWTEVYDNGLDENFAVAYKYAVAGEASSHSFTSTSSAGKSGGILTYRNAAWGSVGSISTTISGSTMTAPGMNVDVDNSTLLAVFRAADGGRSWSNQTTGLVKRLSDETGNGRPSWVVYDDDLYPSGPSGDKSADISGGSNQYLSFLMTLSPN